MTQSWTEDQTKLESTSGPADHRIKIKENNLDKRLKKAMKYEEDSDTNHSWNSGNIPQESEKMTVETGDSKKKETV